MMDNAAAQLMPVPSSTQEHSGPSGLEEMPRAAAGRVRSVIGSHFSAQRMVRHCSRLCSELLESPLLGVFKRRGGTVLLWT